MVSESEGIDIELLSHRIQGKLAVRTVVRVCGFPHPVQDLAGIGVMCGEPPSHAQAHRFFALGHPDAEEVPPRLNPAHVAKLVSLIREHGNEKGVGQSREE